MGAFGFLLLNDLKKFKNYILEIKKKPWKLLIYLLYIAWLGFILFTAFGGADEIEQIKNIEFKMDVFSVIVKTLVLLLFSYTLYSGTKKFDGLFSMGDVNFLFPSPISPKVILTYSMFKQSLLVSISSIFIAFLFPMLQIIYGPLSPIGVVYGLVGVITLFIFTVPFSYLTFVLSTRFGLREWLHYILYAIVIFILGSIAFGIYNQQNILDGLFYAFNQSFFPYIPVVGWTGELIQATIMGKSSLTTLVLVLQVSTIAITTFFAIFLAQDYYEDALPSAELKADLRRKSKEGKRISLPSDKDSKKKIRQVNVRYVGNGPWAFLWMNLVTNKRSSGSLFLRWMTLGILVISITAGLLIPEKTTMVFYIISGVIAYFAFLMSVQISMDYELKMKHIFILPGQPWKKILAVNIIAVLKVCIYMATALLPIGIIFNVPVYSLLAGLVFPISMTILNLFSTVIIHILIPNSFDLKAFFPVIRIFSFLLFLIPPAIAGIWVGIATQDVAIAFYSIALINILMSVLSIWISDRVFWRLEIR